MRTRYEVLASLVMAGLAGTAAYPAQAGLITVTVDQTGGADYTTLSAAVAAANADKNLANTYHIQLAPGTYLNDYANIQRPMEIFGDGANSTVLQSTIALPNQKGIIHTIASLFVKGLTFTGAFIADALGGNGAGIRDQITGAGTLRIEDSVFRGNQEGVLTGGSGNQEHVIVKNPKFLDNGNTNNNAGQEHGIYINDAASVAIDGSLFCGQKNGGHNIKLRSLTSMISNVQSYEGTAGPGCAGIGNASRGIDLPNGGVATLSNVDLFQGAASPNFSLLEFGAEGLKYAQNSLSLNDVAFTSTSGGVGIQWFAGATPCTFQDVTFSGVANQTTPAGVCRTGMITSPGSPTPVNEPGSLALLAAALGLLTGTIRRTRPKA
jgi:hypothetical protein